MLLKNFDIMKCVTAPEDQDIRYQETVRTTQLECSRNELIPFFSELDPTRPFPFKWITIQAINY